MNDSLLPIASLEAKQEIDPDQLVKLLEVQLATERIGWRRKRERARSARAISIAFVVLMLLTIVVAGYIMWNNQATVRPESQQASQAAPDF